MSKKISPTTHAKKRLEERQSVSKQIDVSKLLNKVLAYGKSVTDYQGSFRNFLSNKLKYQKFPNIKIKVYDDYIYILRNRTLITSYKVPENFIPTKRYLISENKTIEEEFVPDSIFIPNELKLLLNDKYGADNIRLELVPNIQDGVVIAIVVNELVQTFISGVDQNEAMKNIKNNLIK